MLVLLGLMGVTSHDGLHAVEEGPVEELWLVFENLKSSCLVVILRICEDWSGRVAAWTFLIQVRSRQVGTLSVGLNPPDILRHVMLPSL